MNDLATPPAVADETKYLEDAQGRLVPLKLISPIDLARDGLVKEIVAGARIQSFALGEFKARVFDDIAAFVELSAEKYGAHLGGSKGNVTLTSFDARYKVQRTIADSLVFDERLQAAKALIDDCIHEWGKTSRPEIMALVNDAFNIDKEGKINTGRVLSLRRLDIKDSKWLAAMQAITDSLRIAGSKAYFRVYERVESTGEYKAIPLDVATA